MAYDLKTFGSDKAAINLTKILDELGDRRHSRRIALLMLRWNRFINFVTPSDDYDMKGRFYEIFRRELKSEMAKLESQNFDHKVLLHAACSIKTKMRKNLLRPDR